MQRVLCLEISILQKGFFLHWEDKIRAYCDKYNIPLYYLSNTLDEPKVIPMIRGKAFEFVVLEELKEILDEDIWEVSKPTINAQLAIHDVDVLVLHRETQKEIIIECKLAKKGSCRVDGDRTTIKVKCMRSRTLGVEMVRQLSPQLGIPEDVLSVHNDQYLERDFDFVITSIGNAFYETDDNGTFFSLQLNHKKSFLIICQGKILKMKLFFPYI